MTLTPCKHCAHNFMRPNTHDENFELCNNCRIRHELNNPRNKKNMETVDILIKVDSKIHKNIEEKCLEKNISFSEYFMQLLTPTLAKEETKKVEPAIEIEEEVDDEDFFDEYDGFEEEEEEQTVAEKTTPKKETLKTKKRKVKNENQKKIYFRHRRQSEFRN